MQIVIDHEGGCEFTRSPHLLGLLHPEDRKEIERMTDIVFHREEQRFFIFMLKGPIKAGSVGILSDGYQTFASDYGGWPVEFMVHTDRGGLCTFATYEEAVQAEIRFVEFLRDTGHSMNG